MAKFDVIISGLQSSAGKIAQACEEYQAAANSLKGAADALAGTWEGDSQVAFVNEQDQANQWYMKMAEIVNDYVAELKKAAEEYVKADQEAARIIGS